MPMTPTEMIKHLKKNGFEEVSKNGSHVKMKNYTTQRQTIVPHHSKPLKKGLEQAILKVAMGINFSQVLQEALINKIQSTHKQKYL